MNEITTLINMELNGEAVDKKETIKRLKPLVNKDTIALAQVDPIVCDIEHNFKKAKIYIEWANELKLGAIVFPELFLMGYPVFDIIDRFPNIVEKNIEYLEKLAKLTGNTKVLIGFCEFNRFYIGKRYFNSVAVLQNKKIEKIIRKTLLPVYSEFNDARYFQ